MDSVLFTGLALSGNVFVGEGEYADGTRGPVESIVALDGVELPRRCSLTQEHREDGAPVGICNTIDLDPEQGVRVFGRLDAVIAASYARNRRYGLSAHYTIEQTVKAPPGTRLKLNGKWITAGPSGLVIITSARLIDVSLLLNGGQGNSACVARLLTAADPAVLHAAARGARGGRSAPSRTARPATIRAAAATIRAASGKSKLPTFSGTAYTGAPMRPEGWWQPVIVDLAGVRIPSQHRPVLRQHDHEQVLGHTTRVKVHPKRGVEIEGVFSGESHHVAKVVEPARNGFLWQLSIGANPTRTEHLEAGETTIINGREVTGPLTISRETEIGEISFVPIGADQETSAHVVAQPQRSPIAAAGRAGSLAHPSHYMSCLVPGRPTDPTANGYRLSLT